MAPRLDLTRDEAESPPIGSPSRRFGLGDVMIVVALSAVLCSAFARSVVFSRIGMYVSYLPGVISFVYFEGSRPAGFLNWPVSAFREYIWITPLTIWMESAPPLLIFSTPAILLVRLRKPRPAWSRLVRQPGFVACAVAIGVGLLEVDLRWLGVSMPANPLLDIAGAVAVSWAALRVSGFWQAEPSWIDRAGRTVGFAWIAMAIVASVAMIRGF